MPKLIIQALDKEWSVELKEGSNVVGRSAKCTIPVQEQNISREHCEIVLTGGVATLFDKGSMNGTILNGKRIWEQKLNPGDHVRIVNAVLWFETKGKSYPMPQEKKGRSTVNEADQGKRQTDVQTRRVSSTKRTESRRSGGGLVQDYAAWGRPGVNWGVILGSLAGVAALIGVAILGLQFLGKGDGPKIDRDNLLRNSSGFETATVGALPGWKLDPPANSELEVTQSASHTGTRSLVLTKSRSPEQSIVSAMLSGKVKAQSDGYRFSAWVKWGTFTGRVALKVSWVRNDGVLFETCSEPVEKSSEWVELSDTFSRPSGAQAFRVGVTAIGRGGRLYIDDLRLVAGGEGTSAKPVSVNGTWDIQISDRGAISISRGKSLLHNVHLRLENEREGYSSQEFLPAEFNKDAGSVRISGEILHPITFESVPYKVHLQTNSGQLWVVYEFQHDDLRQVDRIVLLSSFPRGVTPSSSSGSSRFFEFSVRNNQFALRYPDQIQKIHRMEGGIRQEFSVTRGEKGSTKVGFALLPIGKEDHLKAALKKERDYPGEALEILRGAERRMALSQQDADRVSKKVSQLLKREAREWEKVQSATYSAESLALSELVKDAELKLTAYRRRWGVGEFEVKSSQMETLLSSIKVEDQDGASRGLSQARSYYEAGSSSLAEEILLALLDQFPGSPALEDVQELLQTIQAEE